MALGERYLSGSVYFVSAQADQQLARRRVPQLVDPFGCHLQGVLIGYIVNDKRYVCVSEVHAVESHEGGSPREVEAPKLHLRVGALELNFEVNFFGAVGGLRLCEWFALKRLEQRCFSHIVFADNHLSLIHI